MNELITQLQNHPQTLMDREESKAIQEIQAALLIARANPRDQIKAIERIKTSCSRPGLASISMYAYPKGGQMVTGPSIRLAEVLAQNWGNLDFGIRELSQDNRESVVESFCWDLETNVRQQKIFHVPHEIRTKAGPKKLVDPRDIYELVANQGARRLRACILGIIPFDVTDYAIEVCEKTLKQANGSVPMIDRIQKMVLAFGELGVTSEMLEKRLGHKVEIVIEQELISLQKIYISIKDSFSKREDWFEIGESKGKKTSSLNKIIEEEKTVTNPIGVRCLEHIRKLTKDYTEEDAISVIKESIGLGNDQDLKLLSNLDLENTEKILKDIALEWEIKL